MGIFSKRYTQEEWENMIFQKYGTKYKSLEPYVGMRVKLKFLCVEHGEFYRTPDVFLRKTGCPKCGRKKMAKAITLSQELWDVRRKLIHGEKYECVEPYVDSHTKLKFRCNVNPKHGYFYVSPNNVLSKKTGCKNCANKINSNNLRKNVSYLKLLANKRGGDCLSITYDTMHTKYDWKCGKCKNVWKSSAANIYNGNWCPKCSVSKGEFKISNLLNNLKINYTSEHRFNDCRNKKPLSFDFYLPDFNMCIEYDGIQHYKKTSGSWNTDLNLIKERDQIKNEYCKRVGIQLIRIPYTQINNIETILDEYFKCLN